MVVGPPGTGKTDTAVQVMTTLYHNCPGQRTLLITHSNQALNDLFQKIMGRDVPARYLLRLGACCIVCTVSLSLTTWGWSGNTGWPSSWVLAAACPGRWSPRAAV